MGGGALSPRRGRMAGEGRVEKDTQGMQLIHYQGR